MIIIFTSLVNNGNKDEYNRVNLYSWWEVTMGSSSVVRLDSERKPAKRLQLFSVEMYLISSQNALTFQNHIFSIQNIPKPSNILQGAGCLILTYY